MIYKRFVPTLFRKHLNVIVASIFVNTLVLGLYNHNDHKKIIEKLTKKIDERK